MGRFDSLKNAFSFLSTGSRRENVVTEYILREHHRGRSLEDVLKDPYVTNRCSSDELDRLLDNPEIVRAIGRDIIDAAK